MAFLTAWEFGLFLFLFLELTDGTVFESEYLSLYFPIILRVMTCSLIYLSGLALGKVRLHCVLHFLMYLCIGVKEMTNEQYGTWIIVLIMRFLATIAEMNLSLYKVYEVNGPYGVGYREFQTSSENKPWISVYYPIDKDFYLANKSRRSIQKFRDGWNTAKGMAIGMKALPPLFFKYFTQETLEVIENHELHSDFREKHKKLLPVFWSHGLILNRTMYSAI